MYVYILLTMCCVCMYFISIVLPFWRNKDNNSNGIRVADRYSKFGQLYDLTWRLKRCYARWDYVASFS